MFAIPLQRLCVVIVVAQPLFSCAYTMWGDFAIIEGYEFPVEASRSISNVNFCVCRDECRSEGETNCGAFSFEKLSSGKTICHLFSGSCQPITQLQTTSNPSTLWCKFICPPPFESVGRLCLHKKLEALSWLDGKDYCQTLATGADLAIPTNDNELILMRDYAVDAAWIGGTDEDSKQWKWLNGDVIMFTEVSKFGIDKSGNQRPLQTDEDRCLYLATRSTTGYLFDRPCSGNTLQSLCYYPMFQE